MALRWLLYGLLLLLTLSLQQISDYFNTGWSRPVPVLALCLGVALYQDEFSGAIFGAAAGLLWGVFAGRPAGWLSILLLVTCFFASCLWQLYLKDSWVNFVWITAVSCMFVLGVDFLFFHLLPGYQDPAGYLTKTILPCLVFTSLFSPIFRIAARKISTL